MNAGGEEDNRDREREDVRAVHPQRIDPQRAGDDARGVEAAHHQPQEAGGPLRQQPRQPECKKGKRPGDRPRIQLPSGSPGGQARLQQAPAVLGEKAERLGQRADRHEPVGKVCALKRVGTVAQEEVGDEHRRVVRRGDPQHLPGAAAIARPVARRVRRAQVDHGKRDEHRRDGEERGQTAAQSHAAEPPRIGPGRIRREPRRREQEERRHQELDRVLVHEHRVAGEQWIQRGHGGRQHRQAAVAGHRPDHERHYRDGRDAAGERQELE